MNPANRKANILIVDDEPMNVQMLGQILSQDFNVRVATSGREALNTVRQNIKPDLRPDLILLDIMMPDMDGYTVCEQLKSHNATKQIPIIFITAKTEKEDEGKGFRLGAVDYITKPFNAAIVKARVQNHLDLKQHRDLLEQLVAERTNELIKTSSALKNSIDTIHQAQDQLMMAEKMASLGAMVAAATHDINTPLGLSITSTSLLKEQLDRLAGLFSSGTLKRSDFNKFLGKAEESIRILNVNLEQASKLIQSFKTIAVDQCSDTARKVDFEAYLNEIVASLTPRLKKTPHKLIIECPEKIVLKTYPGAISQIITNLILNSLIHAFDAEPENNIIKIAAVQIDERVNIHYQDNGCGIPQDNIQKIFDPFFTTKRDSGGSGLGLHIVYDLVVRKLGGTLNCDSTPGEGTHFYIEFSSTHISD